MKKIKVKESDIKDGWTNIICVGYCDLQYLLRFREPDFYTCGVYGWKADIYKIDYNTVIVTGYAPFGNIRNYDIVKKYEKKAEKIAYSRYSSEWEKQPKKLEKLLKQFIDEILEKKEEI